MNRRDTARIGEEAAADHLIRIGYRILARNFRCETGEIDLVAADGGTLCFIEVKTRSSGEQGTPEEAVTPAKRSHLRRTARAYLAGLGREPASCRFDVVAVLTGPDGRVRELRVLKDAFA